jgi:hypothetical protein
VLGDSGDVFIVVEARKGIYDKGFIFLCNPYTSHFGIQMVVYVVLNSKC